MGGNIGIDMVLGAIPIIGVIPDYFFKSNTRNMKLIKRWLEKHHPLPAPSSGSGEVQPMSTAGADWVMRPTEM
jgi:hypothetical protein